MGAGFKDFIKGIALVPNTTTQNTTKGDLETLTTDDKLHFFGVANDAVVTETVSATLTNKTLDAGSNTITGLTNTNLSVQQVFPMQILQIVL